MTLKLGVLFWASVVAVLLLIRDYQLNQQRSLAARLFGRFRQTSAAAPTRTLADPVIVEEVIDSLGSRDHVQYQRDRRRVAHRIAEIGDGLRETKKAWKLTDREIREIVGAGDGANDGPEEEV